MSKRFHLPLLAALPALLGSCDRAPDINQYQRVGYNSYEQCMTAYQAQIQQGLQNPCYRNSSYGTGGVGIYRFYGPYTYFSAASTRYVGYDGSGNPARTGLNYDSKSGRYGSFKAPGVSRGGFTTSARAGGVGSSSGSSGSSSSYGG